MKNVGKGAVLGLSWLAGLRLTGGQKGGQAQGGSLDKPDEESLGNETGASEKCDHNEKAGEKGGGRSPLKKKFRSCLQDKVVWGAPKIYELGEGFGEGILKVVQGRTRYTYQTENSRGTGGRQVLRKGRVRK